MKSKVHLFKEKKYKRSLESWGDDFDNRPFIRVKIDEVRDALNYERKRIRIENELKRISALSGDPISNINLIDAWGHTYSRFGNIRDFEK